MPKTKKKEVLEESKVKVKSAKETGKKFDSVEKAEKASKKETKIAKNVTKKFSVKKDDAKKVTNKKAMNEKSKAAKKANIKVKVKSEKTNKKETKPLKKLSKNNVKKEETKYLQEYYDLPYRYNETVVKILAQTPKRLFVYWEVSEKDKQTYINAFGEDFFEKTYPVLLVHNEEMDYTFEVPINDFANSWYLDIQDPKTKYVVQLGRKFRNVQEARASQEVLKEEHINLQNDYIYITDSNELEAPNDHVLFEKMIKQITYRDVKTGKEVTKDISSMLEKLSNTYKDADIESIYKELYGEELSEELLRNPSSGGLLLTSSGAISRV